MKGSEGRNSEQTLRGNISPRLDNYLIILVFNGAHDSLRDFFD